MIENRYLISAYVDLNPIHANMAQSLEESGFTSITEHLIQAGIEAKNKAKLQQNTAEKQEKTTKNTNQATESKNHWLMPLHGDKKYPTNTFIAHKASPSASKTTNKWSHGQGRR